MAEYLIQQPILVLDHTTRSSGPPISRPSALVGRAELLLQVIGSMPKVKKLIMFTTMKPTSPRMRAFEFCMRIIMACGCATFGSTLRSLTLRLTYEGYMYSLKPTLVFPVLEELSIQIAWSPNRPINDGANLMRNLLMPFLNNHHSTLQFLRLGFASFSPLTNISSHLLGMRHLPHMRKLDIFDVSSKSDDSGLRHILEIQSNSLLELSLNFGLDARTSRTEWYARAIFHVALPHLESLKLGSGCFLDLGLTAAYVRRLGESLTIVMLDPDRLSFCEAEIMMNAFAGRATLRTLYLSVTNLSPELLDLLATKLPGLSFLKLTFRGVCVSESHLQPEQGNREQLVSAYKYSQRPTFTRQQFCQCMRDRVYPDWKLQHFIGSFKGNGRKEDILLEWEAAIGVALPQLQTLRVEKWCN
jgi:hypothetical protein